MKTKIYIVLLMLLVFVTGCANRNDDINVVSREEGSGTRGAFIELFDIEVKNDDGTKTDKTSKEAVVVSKTDVVMSTVASDVNAIGYLSLGSLNDSIKATKINNVEATAENIKKGDYEIARPFMIAYKDEISETAKDFIDFIMSADGQAIVSQSYVAVKDDGENFISNYPQGKIVVAGSSSVTPIMEKLKEAYEAINQNAAIEIQMSDSTAGLTNAIENTCDIGMASRKLKDSESEKLNSIEIAYDGIVIIINKENVIDNLSKDDVKQIFTGEAIKWSDLNE